MKMPNPFDKNNPLMDEYMEFVKRLSKETADWCSKEGEEPEYCSKVKHIVQKASVDLLMGHCCIIRDNIRVGQELIYYAIDDLESIRQDLSDPVVKKIQEMLRIGGFGAGGNLPFTSN